MEDIRANVRAGTPWKGQALRVYRAHLANGYLSRGVNKQTLTFPLNAPDAMQSLVDALALDRNRINISSRGNLQSPTAGILLPELLWHVRQPPQQQHTHMHKNSWWRRRWQRQMC